jgi:hypothetical protein
MEYPNLYTAFQVMLTDQGIEHSPPEEVEVTFKWMLKEVQLNGVTSQELATAEWVLNKLTKEERITLAAGDREDWAPLFSKIGPQHETVHRVLDEIFGLMMT